MKFYQKTLKERRQILFEQGYLEDLEALKLKDESITAMIENAIGVYEIPLGVVPDFEVNNKSYWVPIVSEEPSVIAALNNGMKRIRHAGKLTASCDAKILRGEIIFFNPLAPDTIISFIEKEKELIFAWAKEAHPSIHKRGGGLTAISSRILTQQTGSFLILDLFINPLEAMGANIVNTIAEFIAAKLEESLDEEVLMSILSNYTDSLAHAAISLDIEKIGLDYAKRMERASQLAKADIYRAATHNKGIMNGVDGLVIATGNDWRANNAGIYSYTGNKPLSTWEIQDDKLIGQIHLPLQIATVGASIQAHPGALANLKMLKNPSAQELMALIAAVGLVQNFSALSALVSGGIQKGHMQLHLHTLAHNCGASPQEIQALAKSLRGQKINTETVQKALETLRKEAKNDE